MMTYLHSFGPRHPCSSLFASVTAPLKQIKKKKKFFFKIIKQINQTNEKNEYLEVKSPSNTAHIRRRVFDVSVVWIVLRVKGGSWKGKVQIKTFTKWFNLCRLPHRCDNRFSHSLSLTYNAPHCEYTYGLGCTWTQYIVIKNLFYIVYMYQCSGMIPHQNWNHIRSFLRPPFTAVIIHAPHPSRRVPSHTADREMISDILLKHKFKERKNSF